MMLSGVSQKLRGLGFTLLAVIPAVISASDVRAETSYASQQRSNAAMGHYARARAMLVEALAEFEQARKYARPDMLLDPEEWRLSVISRTEELNRVLDPKPRVTTDGVRFQGSPLLIRREKDRTPPVADGAKANNFSGEEQRRLDQRNSRARMDIPDNEPVKVVPKVDQKVELKKEDRELAERKAQENLSFDSNAQSKAEAALQQAVPVDEPAKRAEPMKAEVVTTITTEEVPANADAAVEEKRESVTVKSTAKLIADEEEIDVKPVELPKKEIIPSEEDDATSSAGAQTLEEKEDEVTREIERAIQERIQKEKAGGAAETADDTDGE